MCVCVFGHRASVIATLLLESRSIHNITTLLEYAYYAYYIAYYELVHCIPAVLSSAKGYRGESPREEQGKWDHDEIHKLNFHSTSTISIPLFEIDTECQMMIL